MTRITHHRLFACLLAPAAALALGCGGSEAAVDRAVAGGGADLSVRRGTLTERLLLTGELVAEEAVPFIVPNVNQWPMTIRALADDGAEVRASEPVVEFDNSQLVSNLDEMRTRAIEARLELQSLEARSASEEAQARFELEEKRAALAKARLEAEIPQALRAEIEYRNAQLALRRAELEVAEAEEKLAAQRRAAAAAIEIQRVAFERARSQLARAVDRVEILTLRAPRDGIVLVEHDRQDDRPYQAGDSIYPGSVVARLPDLETMIVSALLFDVDDGRVEPGVRATATLDAFPDEVYAGRVRTIDVIAEQASRTSSRRGFELKLELDRLDVERMRPGMSVKVLIERAIPDALLVPRVSLEWRDGAPRALRADGTWVPVTLGACDAADCVLRSGLEAGTKLARGAADQTARDRDVRDRDAERSG